MYYIIALCLLMSNAAQAISVEINKEHLNSKKEPMNVMLACVGQNDNELSKCINLVSKALEFSGQFKVQAKNFEHPKTKKEIVEIFKQGYALVIFINYCEDKNALEWRLYDATEAIMFKGKKLTKRSNNIRAVSYALADDLWEALTGKKGFFCTKIAYTKRVKNIPGKQDFIICCCDYDGSNEEKIISTPGVYVGLYWNIDSRPLSLLCSEFTRFNVHLISASLTGAKKVIFNFKGTCVGVSLSKDLQRAVYCRSGNIWLYEFDQATKKGSHKVLIKNDGKNVEPILLANGDVIFCSDSKKLCKKVPKICYFKSSDGSIELITKDGYCIGPAYCSLNNKIAYSKRVNGTMQLFVYDMLTKNHEQLTFDSANKIECCWSHCGNYLIFCSQKDGTSRLAMLNILLKEKKFITALKDYCSSPAASNVYA